VTPLNRGAGYENNVRNCEILPVLGAQPRAGIKSSSEISAGKLLGRKAQLSLFTQPCFRVIKRSKH